MADNVTFAAVTSAVPVSTIVAADEIAGIKHQRVKIQYGTDGSATDVAPTTPLPIVQPLINTYLMVCAASTNAVNVSAISGHFRSITGFNYAEYPIKVCLHDTAGTPTAGAGVVWQQVVQGGTALNVGIHGNGKLVTNGIGITIVKVNSAADIAVTGNTATAANDGQFEIGYS